jgi:2-phosphoglycerate kinase
MEEPVSRERAFHRSWDVLLIGGVSGAGKTTAAREIARRLVVPWIGVDDLRLALQWSRVTLPEPRQTEALYLFLDNPDVWKLPAERLRDGLIDVAELMMPAIEIVTENHLHNRDPLIIEGDGIHPAIVERENLREDVEGGSVRAVFVHEPDADVLYASYLTRARLLEGRGEAELRNEATAKALFSAWIADEAACRGLAVVNSRPLPTLIDRILSTA